MLPLMFSVLCVLAVFGNASADQPIAEQEVIWKPCETELKGEMAATDLKVFVPDCPPVNGTETKCQLSKGHDTMLKIQFKSLQAVPNLERLIVAKVPTAAGIHVEMPYGPSISPCDNSSTVADDGSGCLDGGIQPDKHYTYTSVFKVLKSFPSVEDITTKVILRQKLDEHKKLRLYRRHPGPNVFCVMIPNIEVVDAKPEVAANASSS